MFENDDTPGMGLVAVVGAIWGGFAGFHSFEPSTLGPMILIVLVGALLGAAILGSIWFVIYAIGYFATAIFFIAWKPILVIVVIISILYIVWDVQVLSPTEPWF